MFTNYWLTAWRHLWKNKTFSLINMMGLAIGMAVCILIMLFVFHERSFDNFHTKHVYRLNEVQNFEGMVAPQKVAISMWPMGPTLKKEFPEVINFTRLKGMGIKSALLEWNTKRIVVPGMLWADSTFLDLFDFKLLEGNRKTALAAPGNAVLTRDMATKMFGSTPPLGKTITYYGNDTIPFIVTGILENVPANSHLQFEVLFSFNTQPGSMEAWTNNNITTYLELDKHTDIAALEKKFPAYLQKYKGEKGPKEYTLYLQPLQAIHSQSGDILHDYLNINKFSESTVNIFMAIAIIVLLIACINFMNLSTARSATRAKEVGVRKSIGAYRFQLSLQFIGESILLCFIAMAVAVAIVMMVLPSVAAFSQRPLQFPLLSSPWVLPVLLAGTVFIGMLSGLYPAAYLSSFKPTQVLKGISFLSFNKSHLRNGLVLVQFSSAVFLIIATIFAFMQLRYMQQKDPGFSREQVMLIPLGKQSGANYAVLKQELLKDPLVAGATGAHRGLGNTMSQWASSFQGDGPRRSLVTTQIVVDPDFLSVYKIPLVAGRNFSGTPGENGKTFIINESLARELLKDKPGAPLESLIGKRFGNWMVDSMGTITGIVKDFNFSSLHHKIETLGLFNYKEFGYSEMSVKLHGQTATAAIHHIQSTWKKLFPEEPFEYNFLDEQFASLYKDDAQTSKIIGVLAILAIIIACLGLFGLASYAAERRIREVGIRKVLGASVTGLVSLLSKDFLKPVLIANIISWPLAWLALHQWLQQFAYRISIDWWVFALAGIGALMIALVTVSFQALKAATTNPVQSLRSE